VRGPRGGRADVFRGRPRPTTAVRGYARLDTWSLTHPKPSDRKKRAAVADAGPHEHRDTEHRAIDAAHRHGDPFDAGQVLR
jgi:hypothetical protein